MKPSRLPVFGSSAALLIVGFASLIIIVAAAFWLAQRSQVYFDRVLVDRDIRASANELRYALQTAETSQRGFLVGGNQIYLAPYATAKTLAERELDKLDRLLADSEQAKPALGKLKEVIRDKFGEMDETIGLKRDRQDADALGVFRTNRGKALMDEANVFLSSFMRAADQRLVEGVAEQKANAALLRIVTIIGSTLVVLVVAIVIWTIAGYARQLGKARESVEALNTTLEKRVEDRTADLTRERNRVEVLLSEVNHRVANSLALVASMVKLQSRAADSEAAKEVLAETEARIYAVSLLHKRLYSSGDVRFVALDEYLSGLLGHLETSIRQAGPPVLLKQSLEPIKLPTDKSVNLGVVATEWVTNAFKYAYPSRPGEVRVMLRRKDGNVELSVEDDGVGRDTSGRSKGTGLGSKLVDAMALGMDARVEYRDGGPGTTARLIVPETAIQGT